VSCASDRAGVDNASTAQPTPSRRRRNGKGIGVSWKRAPQRKPRAPFCTTFMRARTAPAGCRRHLASSAKRMPAWRSTSST